MKVVLFFVAVGALFLLSLFADDLKPKGTILTLSPDAGDHIFFVAYAKMFDPKTNSWVWKNDDDIPCSDCYGLVSADVHRDSFFGGTDRIEEVHLTDAQWENLVEAESTIDDLMQNAKPFQIQDSK